MTNKTIKWSTNYTNIINFSSTSYSYAYVSHKKTFSAIGEDFTVKLKAWAEIMSEFFKSLTQRNKNNYIVMKDHLPLCLDNYLIVWN